MAGLDDAVASAIESVNSELGGGEATPAADPTPEPSPEPAAAEPEPEPAPAEPKPAAQPEPDDDEPLNLNAAELKVINENALLKKSYNQIRKAFSQKTMALAETRKSLEEKAAIADWIQANPQEAVRQLAQATGMSLAQAEKTAETAVADDLSAEYEKTVGPEAAKLLRPLFEATAKKVLESQLTPLAQQTAELREAAQERAIAAATESFGARVTSRGDNWTDEIKIEMAKQVARSQPGEGVTIDQYLEDIYDTVQARLTRVRGLKKEISRLRELPSKVEPTNAARPTTPSGAGPRVGMKEKDAIEAAVAAAEAEMR